MIFEKESFGEDIVFVQKNHLAWQACRRTYAAFQEELKLTLSSNTKNIYERISSGITNEELSGDDFYMLADGILHKYFLKKECTFSKPVQLVVYFNTFTKKRYIDKSYSYMVMLQNMTAMLNGRGIGRLKKLSRDNGLIETKGHLCSLVEMTSNTSFDQMMSISKGKELYSGVTRFTGEHVHYCFARIYTFVKLEKICTHF